MVLDQRLEDMHQHFQVFAGRICSRGVCWDWAGHSSSLERWQTLLLLEGQVAEIIVEATVGV